MNSNQQMEQALDYLLETAKEQKLALEVMAFQKSSTGISFQERKLEQFSFSETRQLGLRVLDGKHEGVAYTESLDRDSLDNVLSEARANAKMIEREWISQLHAEKNLPQMNELYNPSLEDVSTDDKIEAAKLLESAALDFDPRIEKVASARYGDTKFESWLANSEGLRASFKGNTCFGYAYPMAKDGDNNVMAYHYGAGRDFKKLDAAAIAKRSAEKTLQRIGASRPKTGLYTVVFENRVAESLIEMITGYFSAKSVDKKSSPLAGKLGQPVLSKKLNLTDDPFFTAGHGARPFDDEGYVSRKTALVENGVIANFLTNSIMAKKLNLAHTASAARSPSSDLDVSASNVVVTPGKSSLNDLLNADGQVILITDVLGRAGFRATSGDFSLPVEGHLYSQGKASRPLKDFLISGNILQLLNAVEEVGSDALAPIGNTICPSLLVRGVNVAGQA
jgi:PmbA protein